MRRLWLMVRKDLQRQLRSPLAMGLTLAFPVIFAGLLALTFGGGGDRMPRVVLLVEDLDHSLLSKTLLSASGNEEMARYFDVRAVGPEGRAKLERGEASALLRIPAGFGRDYLAGRPVQLEFVRNPAQGILPEIAEQSLAVLADVLTSASRALRDPLSQVGAMVDEGGASPSATEVAAIAVAAHGAIARAERMVFPPRITLESVEVAAGGGSPPPPSGGARSNVFLLILPGVAVWSLFLIGDMAMRDLMTEGTQGTLRRQLAGPLPPWQVVAGKALFSASVSTISLILLAAIGWAVARRPIDPAGFLLLSAVVILAVTGFAATIYGGATTERQGATLSNLLLLAFAFAGGAFIPVNSLPAVLRGLAPLSPFYWGGEGYKALVRGAGIAQILPHIAILAALGAALLAIGTLLLGRKVRRGAAA